MLTFVESFDIFWQVLENNGRPVASMRQVRRPPPCAALNLEKSEAKTFLALLTKTAPFDENEKKRILHYYLNTNLKKYYKNIISKLSTPLYFDYKMYGDLTSA